MCVHIYASMYRIQEGYRVPVVQHMRHSTPAQMKLSVLQGWGHDGAHAMLGKFEGRKRRISTMRCFADLLGILTLPDWSP